MVERVVRLFEKLNLNPEIPRAAEKGPCAHTQRLRQRGRNNAPRCVMVYAKRWIQGQRRHKHTTGREKG